VTPDGVRLTSEPAGIVQTTDTFVTALASGDAELIADAGPAEDTALVTVAPNDTVAVVFSGGLGTVRLDGLGLTRIPVAHTYTGGGLAWAPDGSYLVGGFDDAARALYRVTIAGASLLIVPSGTSVGQVTAVDVSADGQWIYFSAGNCNFNEIMYRVPVAGGTPARVSAPSSDDCFARVHADVSLAPDGLRAVVDSFYGNGTPVLEIVDLTTGLATSLNIAGSGAKWSPRGDRIAYVGDNRVWIVSPDGTDAMALSPPNTVFVPVVSWSPDGQWLAYQYPTANRHFRWVLLRVATGQLVPLPTTFDTLGAVTWRRSP